MKLLFLYLQYCNREFMSPPSRAAAAAPFNSLRKPSFAVSQNDLRDKGSERDE